MMNVDPPNQPKPIDPVEKSVAKESAFSKPGTTKSSGWKPAKGTRFRPASAGKGKARIGRPRDPRYVRFY